jgi:hypothetical protein
LQSQQDFDARRPVVQYTIEARQLSSEYLPQRPSVDAEPHRMIVEADDAVEALSRFVRDDEFELVSFQSVQGRESIATVRKNDLLYLIRVYSA